MQRFLLKVPSVIPPAQGVFGTGRSLPPGNLNRHADKIWQKCIVFNFQHSTLFHHFHMKKRRIQKIYAAESGAKSPIQSNAHIPRRKEKGFPVIGNNRLRPQAFSLKLAVKFDQQGITRLKKIFVIPHK